MRRRRRRNSNLAQYLLAFAVGLLACLILPARFMVFILVAALLVCSLFCGRC